MNKKGHIIELFGLLFIIGITIVGATTVYYQKDNLYVGYEHIAYKYSECKSFIDNLPQEKLVVFSSKEEVERNKDFKLGDCK